MASRQGIHLGVCFFWHGFFFRNWQFGVVFFNGHGAPLSVGVLLRTTTRHILWSDYTKSGSLYRRLSERLFGLGTLSWNWRLCLGGRAPLCVRVHTLFEDGKSYIPIPLPPRVDYRRRWIRIGFTYFLKGMGCAA